MIPPVLALLIAGHLLADFGLQPAGLVRRKDRVSGMLGHGLILFGVHLAALWPYLGPDSGMRVVVAVAGVVVLHLTSDTVKGLWVRRHGDQDAGPFFADQAAHLFILLGAWAWLGAPTTDWRPDHLQMFVTAVAGLASVSLVWIGGASVVRVLLRALPVPDDDGQEAQPGARRGGRTIGILERLLVLVLVATGHTASIAFVLAAKSIARFEDLKVRRFAEYYLVGTLASFLVAVVAGLYLVAAAGPLP